MEEQKDRDPSPVTTRRRRRRPSTSEEFPFLTVEDQKSPARPDSKAEQDFPSGWRKWGHKISYFGLSSAFRAYLFVGGVLAVLAFILYNESLIQEFEEEKKEQVGLYAALYAFAVSKLATTEQTGLIFREVIVNPRIDFPIIFTNYKGEITDWKGEGLPAVGDTSKVSMQVLRDLLEKMDGQHEPIPVEAFPDLLGLLYYEGANFIITNGSGDIAGWRGDDLPTANDTTTAALDRVREAVVQMASENEPHEFSVAAGTFSYLHGDEKHFFITDSSGKIVEWWGEDLPAKGNRSAGALAQVKKRMLQLDRKSEPYPFKIPSESLQYIHYGDSELVSRISWANFIVGGVLLVFSLVGYIGFRNIRRSEQRSIWVGMAKETAHQLGTPLSSLSGWLELIRHELVEAAAEDSCGRLQRVDQKVGEMQKDMRRLNQIALRFSQIGSVPEVEMGDIEKVLGETVNYFRSRGSQFGQCDINMFSRAVPPVPLNAELLSWAFENLFKNGMDAIGRQAGVINIRLDFLAERKLVQIVFQDNGCGIEPENVNRVFEPGFSTKKRGWGLGLAFVRRIIEEYHKGKISITHSVPGEGTTFEVLLPVA